MKHRLWSVMLVPLVLTVMLSCRGAQDRFLQVRNGMSEGEVTNLLGKPTSVFNAPFSDRYRPRFGDCGDAVRCYVYDRGDEGLFLVYFDSGGRSTCNVFSQEFSPIQR
jgi:hypothetical protein